MKSRQIGLRGFFVNNNDKLPAARNSGGSTSNQPHVEVPPTFNVEGITSSSSQELGEQSGPRISSAHVSACTLRKKRKSEYVIGRSFRTEWLAEFPYIECTEINGEEWIKCKVCTWAFSRDCVIQCKYDTIAKHHGKKKHVVVDDDGTSFEAIEWLAESRHQKNLKKYEEHLLKLDTIKEKKTVLHDLFSRQERQDCIAKTIQMRAVFYLLNNGKPLRQYTQLRELFLCNKIPSCPLSHWSVPSGWELADSMSEALKQELCITLKESVYLSLSLDEVIAVDNTAWIAMHLYNIENFQRRSHFLGIQKLNDDATAESLLNVLLDHLSNVAGLSLEECAQKLICFGADGASVMQGKVTGLGVRIQSKIAPYAQVLHCMSHRTNLAYKTISDHPLVGKVELLLKKAYKFFSSSPKHMSSFKSFAEGITDGNRLLKDVSTRWISLNGPVRRLCEEYISVAGAAYEFKGSSDLDTSVMALELYGLLTDGETLFTLFALQPLLSRLNYLIKLSQDSDIFIPEYSMARTMVQNEVENMYVDNVDTGKSWYECGKKGLFDMWKKLVAIGTDKSFLKYNRDGVLCIHVKGKFLNLKVSKESGRGGHKRRVDFQSSDFESMMDNVKGNMKQIACKLANELRCRFPPDELLEAIGIVFPHFWNHVHFEQSCSIAFQAKFKVIKKYFCCTKVIDGVTIKGLLDFEQLKVQAFMFGETMYQQFLELEDPLKFGAATRLWRKLASNTVLRAAISEYFKLAELCLCMILGSVEDERCFSTLSFIKNKLCNHLEGNLDATLRLYECDYKMEDFPYDTAFQIWNDSRKRRGSSKLHVGDVDASHASVVEEGAQKINRTVRLWSLDNIDEESVQPK